MTLEIGLVFFLLLSAIVLFATEKVSVDVVTLLLICVLIIFRVLTPAEAFAGFSSDVLVMLGAIFILSGALQQTGVLEGMAALLLKLAGAGKLRLLALLMLSAGTVSAFMNNTTVVAMFVPPVTGMARRAGISASKLLMPLAFAAIMGGTCTLIGTSTNIAVSGYIAKAGMEPLGLFEFAPIGIVCLIVGTAYMTVIGQRFLPTFDGDAVTDPVEARNYFAEVVVQPGSPLIGESAFGWELSLVGFRIIQISRENATSIPDQHSIIEAGDILVVEGKVVNLNRIRVIEGLKFKSELGPGDIEGDVESDVVVAEAIVLPGSELGGATLEDVQFRQRYGLTVLAVNRSGQPLFEKLERIRLREADVLLIHGPGDRVEALLRTGSRLQKLGNVDEENRQPVSPTRKGWTALAIFALSLVVGVAGWVPMSGAFLTGAVLVILTGCITAEKAHEFIDWRLLILVGGMTAFGTAMEKTGAAELLSGWIVSWLAPMGIIAVLAGFFFLTIVLTQPMSNAAAALVVLPIAMSAATEMGANPRTFAIAIMLAASISFIAPLEPACVLVYGVGKYRFRDFLVVGGLLTVLLAVIVLLMLPLFWNLHAD
jgi:di/tricarboxylate transporter